MLVTKGADLRAEACVPSAMRPALGVHEHCLLPVLHLVTCQGVCSP